MELDELELKERKKFIKSRDLLIESHQKSVTNVLISNDNYRLVSSSNDMTIRIWDIPSRTQLKKIKQASYKILVLALTKDDRILITSCDKLVIIWDFNRLTSTAELSGHTETIKCGILAFNDTILITGGYDSTIRTWCMSKLVQLLLINIDSYTVSCLTFSPQTQTLAIAAPTLCPLIFSFKNHDSPIPLNGKHGTINTLVFINTNKLVSGSNDECIRLWDCDKLVLEQVVKVHSNYIKSILACEEGEKLICASSDMTISIISAEYLKVIGSFKAHSAIINCLGLIDGGKGFVSGAIDGSMKIWKARENGFNEELLPGHTKKVLAVRFIDESRFISYSEGEINIWNLNNNHKHQKRIQFPKEHYTSIEAKQRFIVICKQNAEAMVFYYNF